MDLLKDLRFGFRSLVGSPGLTLVALVAVAAAFGCFVPARRAMTVEPVVALHHE